MDTLAIGYKFPTIRALYGLAPIRLRPCWANQKAAAEFIRCCNLFVLLYYSFLPLFNAMIDVIAPPIAAARASTQTSNATLSPVAGLLLLPSTA